MFLKNWKRVPVVSLLALMMILSLMTSCNDPDDFDPSELFSLEDYVTDQDYMVLLVQSMNHWYVDANMAKSYLDINATDVPFNESVPPGWELLSESNLVSQPGDTMQTIFDMIGPEWYVHPVQDAEYNIVRFNYGITDPEVANPALVEYGVLFSEMTQEGNAYPNHAVGVAYQDEYQNKSLLIGGGNNNDVNLIFATSGGGGNFIINPAVFSTQIVFTIDEMSSSMDNPLVTGTFTGLANIRRVASMDMVDLDITGEINIRSNGRGNATLSIDGIERVRVEIEYIDTSYHGYYSLRETNFAQREAF
jgi:hypothetical protein